MPTFAPPTVHAVDLVAAVVIPIVYILACSWGREPGRRHFQAVIVAGAGATYLNGGLGGWEFAFNGLMTFLAFKGLNQYRYLGVGWLCHTGWDVVHHLTGAPILRFLPASSAGCAICDTILALWCFAGAPSALRLVGKGRAVEGHAGA